MSVELRWNQYGKSRVRLARVSRHGDRHDFRDLTVGVHFQGDFAAAHTQGDNTGVLPTDTMKNTVYALAADREPGEIEEFGLRLEAHFLKSNPQVSRVRIDLVEHPWTRVAVGAGAHPHAFLKTGPECRTATVTGTREGVIVEAGIGDLTILKTTRSSFAGFHKDAYTTLPETEDRILGTVVQASWIYATAEVAFGPCRQAVRRTLIETFAGHDSRSVQQTAYAMGQAVLESHEQIEEIRLSLPNRHCLPVDLRPFGLENRNEVFMPVEEPHGLIEVKLGRRAGGSG